MDLYGWTGKNVALMEPRIGMALFESNDQYQVCMKIAIVAQKSSHSDVVYLELSCG